MPAKPQPSTYPGMLVISQMAQQTVHMEMDMHSDLPTVLSFHMHLHTLVSTGKKEGIRSLSHRRVSSCGVQGLAFSFGPSVG